MVQAPAPSLRETIEDGAPAPPQMTPAASSGVQRPFYWHIDGTCGPSMGSLCDRLGRPIPGSLPFLPVSWPATLMSDREDP